MLIPASLPFTLAPYSLGASALFSKSDPQSMLGPKPTSCMDTPRPEDSVRMRAVPGEVDAHSTLMKLAGLKRGGLSPLRDSGLGVPSEQDKSCWTLQGTRGQSAFIKK